MEISTKTVLPHSAQISFQFLTLAIFYATDFWVENSQTGRYLLNKVKIALPHPNYSVRS